MKKTFFALLICFAAVKSKAQYPVYGNGGFNLQSNPNTFYVLRGSDTLFRVNKIFGWKFFGRIFSNPDSLETITSLGSDFLQVVDATTGRFKKIAQGNISFPYSLSYQAVAATSDATPTNLTGTPGAITIPDNSVGIIKVHLVANGGSGLATHKIQGVRYYTFNKNAGTLTIDAADVIIADKEGGSVTAASWQVTSLSNQPVIEVTGVVGININWGAAVEIVVIIN